MLGDLALKSPKSNIMSPMDFLCKPQHCYQTGWERSECIRMSPMLEFFTNGTCSGKGFISIICRIRQTESKRPNTIPSRRKLSRLKLLWSLASRSSSHQSRWTRDPQLSNEGVEFVAVPCQVREMYSAELSLIWEYCAIFNVKRCQDDIKKLTRK